MSNWQSRKIGGSPRFTQAARQGSRSVFSWLLLAVVFLVVLYVLFYVLPRVTIILVPEFRQLNLTETIDLVQSRSVENATDALAIKQLREEAAVEDHFVASGKKNIGERASGLVSFFNQTGLPFELLVEDGLETLSGTKFTVTNNLTIPAAKLSAEGEIVPGLIAAAILALAPGTEYNVPVQRIYISAVSADRQDKIYGQLDAATTDGSDELVTVVSQTDIDSAKARLEESIKQALQSKMELKEAGEWQLLPETFSLADEKFDTEIEVDEESTEFTASLSGWGSVLTYQKSGLIDLARVIASRQISAVEELLGDQPQELKISVNIEPALASAATLEISWPVSQRVNLNDFKAAVLGLREADARRELLAEPLIADVRFDWNLAVSHRIPRFPSHVSLILLPTITIQE